MGESRSVSENHGDYEFEVVQGQNEQVKCFKCLINASPDTKKRQRIAASDLPSESLKDSFARMVGKPRAELNL